MKAKPVRLQLSRRKKPRSTVDGFAVVVKDRSLPDTFRVDKAECLKLIPSILNMTGLPAGVVRVSPITIRVRPELPLADVSAIATSIRAMAGDAIRLGGGDTIVCLTANDAIALVNALSSDRAG